MRKTILSETLLGTISAVDTGTEEITVSAAHGLVTGDRVRFQGGTIPAPVVATTIYFAVVTSATKIKLSDTHAHALAGTNLVNITGTDTGSNVIKVDMPWVDVGDYDGLSLYVKGLSASDLVRIFVTNEPGPTPDTVGIQLGADFTAENFRNIPERPTYLRATKVSATGNATLAKAYLHGTQI